MAQNYSGNAIETSLVGGISNVDTTLTLSSTTGWPAAPFVATLERETVREEQVYVGARAGSACSSITRGYASTTALAHSAGAVIEHTVDAVSMQRWEDHLADPTAAHAASAIANTPSGNIVATTVQSALNELDTEKALITEPIAAAHVALGTGSHAATAISFSPTGTIAATNAQAAIAEVATDTAATIAALGSTYATDAELAAAVSAHEADTTSVHGITNTANVVINTRQVVSGNGLTGGGDLSADRTLAVGAGTGITVAADAIAIDTALVDLGAASTTWTTTFGGGGSPTVGNATVSARWMRTGRLINFWLVVNCGSTTNLSTGQLTIALPVAAVAAGAFVQEIAFGRVVDTSAGTSTGLQGHINHNTSSSVMVLSYQVDGNGLGTADYLAAFNHAAPYPINVGANDSFNISGCYESAS